MSRINRYQENVLKFLKTRSFISKTSNDTQQILNDLLELSDHIPAILCLTILNNQCKKYNLKIHGYYIAAGVDMMMLMAKVCCNRDYFNKTYGEYKIDNMIIEVTNWFYYCISQNIETLNLSKNGKINVKTYQLCTEYATKYLPLITKKTIYASTDKMKKTDIMNYKFDPNKNIIKEYKKKNKLDKEILYEDIDNRYGSVCKLAICLGWILGQGDEASIPNLEKLAKWMSIFLKMSDDFKYLERDMLYGKTSLNYVVNYGIKEAYMEIIESKTDFIEVSMHIGVDTKTTKEIIDMVVKEIDALVHDVSVDIDTQYDDISV
jgi:hypothetical protein